MQVLIKCDKISLAMCYRSYVILVASHMLSHVVLYFTAEDMATAGFSPISGDSKQTTSALKLSSRLKCCWKFDFDWTLFPEELKKVSN